MCSEVRDMGECEMCGAQVREADLAAQGDLCSRCQARCETDPLEEADRQEAEDRCAALPDLYPG